MNKITLLKKKLQNLKNKYWLALAANAVIVAGDCGHKLMTEEKKQDKVEVKTAKPSDADLKAEEKSFVMPFLLLTEGCTLKVYTDGVGVRTVGIGSTYTKDGKKVGPNDNLSSNEEAIDLALFIYDKNESSFEYIERSLRPNQRAAIGDCMYNCGPSVLFKDGKQTKLCKAINEGNDAAAMEELLTYNKAGGSFSIGLFFRRVLEAYVYQDFISAEEMQKCIIGGLGSVCYNKEMQKAFNLKITKKGGKNTATYDIKALKSKKVAREMINICQEKINIKLSKKLEAFNFGKQVSNFIPEQYLCKNSNKQKKLLTHEDWVKKVQDRQNLNRKS